MISKQNLNVVKPQPVETLETVPLMMGDEEKLVYMGTRLQSLEKKVIECLWAHADMFAWKPADMPRIGPNVISHHLNACLDVRSIKQKKRHIAPKQLRPLEEEVEKLFIAGFIREKHYLD